MAPLRGMVVRLQGRTQCCNCAVTHLIVKLPGVFHSVMSPLETGIIQGSVCSRTVSRKEWNKSGCQL